MRVRVPAFLCVVGGLLIASASTLAQEKPKIEQTPIPRIAASDGAQMFGAYCSPCHGQTGRGDGPAGPALKKAPADLTTLTARNGGKFPEVRVKRYIEGLDEVPAHGSRDMPVWGPLFRELSRDTALIRVEALSNHLKTLQK
jgi:mono/diheme cytochrome c family protein